MGGVQYKRTTDIRLINQNTGEDCIAKTGREEDEEESGTQARQRSLCLTMFPSGSLTPPYHNSNLHCTPPLPLGADTSLLLASGCSTARSRDFVAPGQYTFGNMGLFIVKTKVCMRSGRFDQVPCIEERYSQPSQIMRLSNVKPKHSLLFASTSLDSWELCPTRPPSAIAPIDSLSARMFSCNVSCVGRLLQHCPLSSSPSILGTNGPHTALPFIHV